MGISDEGIAKDPAVLWTVLYSNISYSPDVTVAEFEKPKNSIKPKYPQCDITLDRLLSPVFHLILKTPLLTMLLYMLCKCWNVFHPLLYHGNFSLLLC